MKPQTVHFLAGAGLSIDTGWKRGTIIVQIGGRRSIRDI